MATKLTYFYDVIYLTKSGRGMVSKRIAAKTDREAKAIVKKQMRASKTFKKVVMAIKLY